MRDACKVDHIEIPVRCLFILFICSRKLTFFLSFPYSAGPHGLCLLRVEVGEVDQISCPAKANAAINSLQKLPLPLDFT